MQNEANKDAQRRALQRGGVSTPRWGTATTGVESETVAEGLGLPLVVKPVDASGSLGVTRVDHLDDVSLAFRRAVRHSAAQCVIIEEFVPGPEYCVFALRSDGKILFEAVSLATSSHPPYCYHTSLTLPAPIEDSTRATVRSVVRSSLDALKVRAGPARVELILSEAGPRVIEVELGTGSGQTAYEVFPVVYGWDYTAAALRLTAGKRVAPAPDIRAMRCGIIVWIPVQPGIVTEVRGIEAAREIPGVALVKTALKGGEFLAHISDSFKRDSVGYVVASGETPERAAETARVALDVIQIVTRPSVHTTP